MTSKIPKIQPLTQANFRHFISSHPKAIVLFTYFGEFSKALREYFAAEYGAEIAFGSIKIHDIMYRGWAHKYVGSVLSPTQQQSEHAPDGYYLFLGGRAVGYHSGEGTDSSEDKNALAADAVVAFFALLANQRMDSSVYDRLRAQRIISHFEGIITSFRNSPPLNEGDDVFARAVQMEDPYDILGVARVAANGEIKAAYKQRMQENHPDKVAHMSEAIRRTAERETKKIQTAYSTIMAERQRRTAG